MLLAIKRAEIFSPNSIDKDTAIIEQVAQLLSEEGFGTRIASESEELPDVEASLFVSMGRKPETLEYLKAQEARGAIVVNSAEGVELCCHRHKMRGILESAGIPLAPLEGNDGYWVKRADGVATTHDDVKYVKTREEAAAYEQWLRSEKGAQDVEVTAHVVGDVIKFYGVRHTDFFRCYYSSEDGKTKFGDESINGLPHHYEYNKVELHATADRAAETVGVDVYGGDVIIRPDGSMAIVDLNDWPSFSRCREEAAKAIADMIMTKKENKSEMTNIFDGIKGIIFDYGGTLDTCGCHWGKMIWHAYERNNVPVSEAEFRDAYVYAERELGKNPIIQPDYTFKKTLETKLKIELEYLVSSEQRVVSSEPTATKANSGEAPLLTTHYSLLTDLYSKVQSITSESVRVLTELRKHYPMVLVSNFYGNISCVLKEFGFDGLFDNIIESAVVGVRKPDPRIFTLGVEALGLKPEEVLVVGDSYDKDILAAKKAGCRTVWMRGEGWTDDEPDGAMADMTIDNLNQLLITLNTSI